MKCPVVDYGKVVLGDSRDLLGCLPDKSVNMIITSPPYANKRSKFYGSVNADEYPNWFVPFAKEISRVLADDGSFVFNIKEHVQDGERSDYVHETIKKIREQGFRWNETYIWEKTNPYPGKFPGRFKDGFEYIYHFTKSPSFKFRPDAVKVPGKIKCDQYKKEHEREKGTARVSKTNNYRNYSDAFLESCKDGMVYPSNIIVSSVHSRASNEHPAMFPEKIPSFFINLLTDPGDVVLDPFAGSGTANVVAKRKCRKTIGFDSKQEYVDLANKRIGETDECSE